LVAAGPWYGVAAGLASRPRRTAPLAPAEASRYNAGMVSGAPFASLPVRVSAAGAARLPLGLLLLRLTRPWA
jgi:hypothetical protein